jgi:quinol monooxygenase YgiN
MADEIVSLAVLEAFSGKQQELLAMLRDFYSMMNRKDYCRDLLYRDKSRPDRFFHLRNWKSAQARADAQVDPEVHRYWRRLPELCTVTAYENLEKVFES